MKKLLLALLLMSALAFAQTAINGTIRGHATDASGSSIAAAKVTVVNDGTGFERAVDSNEDGLYVLPNLPLGTYTLTIQKAGFNTDKHPGIVLDAGSEAVIDGQLKVGSVETTVEVTGGAPIVDPSRTSTGRTISFEETNNLPLTSRNPYNFVLFQPGVSGHPNPELGIPRLMNTNGLADRVNYQLDGTVDTESDRYGIRLFAIANSYVAEVQTVSNSFSPEFGKTAGNIYNVITGSGSNMFHGQFQYIGRPLGLVARPILATATTIKPVADNLSANAGGAIIKNKLFFFGAYEHVKRSTPNPITITAANAAALGITAAQLTNPPAEEHAHFMDTRLDWSISAKHQAFIRYNFFRNEYPFNTNVGGLNTQSVGADFKDRAHVLGAQIISSFSATVLNELRFGWPYRNQRHLAGPTTGAGPEILISGAANIGGSNATGDRFQEKIPNLNDNVTVIRGAHTIKGGYGFQQNLDTQFNQIFTQYNFPSIAAYQSALSGANPLAYSTYAASVGTPGASYHTFFWDVFLQDSWQVTSKILVVGGLRYDKFNPPPPSPTAIFSYSQSFRTPNKDFAPRLGIAWSPNSKTVVRVNSGIFYEAPPTNMYFRALFSDGGSASYAGTISSAAAGAPRFPSAAAGALPRSSTDIYTITPNYKNGYAINSSFQITRQLGQNDALTIGYANTKGRNLLYLRNMNLINPVNFLADGRPVFSSAINAATRLDPRVNNIALQDSGASSSYNALITNYQHRMKQGLTVNASYTWSHTITDAPEAHAFDQTLLFIGDPTNRRNDHANSIINRPNAFSLTSVYAPTVTLSNKVMNYLANNNQLTLLALISSGDQQTITANAVLNGDALGGSGNGSASRPLYTARNTVRTPSVYQFDARYSRTFFKLRERIAPSFFMEANNLFNHPNITSLNTVASVNSTGAITAQPSFAPTATLLEGRIIQLGVRASW